MAKKQKSEAPKPLVGHGGACPTCGHCKCCEKATKAIYPICTRPHYPVSPWKWEPLRVWYGTDTSTNPALTTTTSANVPFTLTGDSN